MKIANYSGAFAAAVMPRSAIPGNLFDHLTAVGGTTMFYVG